MKVAVQRPAPGRRQRQQAHARRARPLKEGCRHGQLFLEHDISLSLVQALHSTLPLGSIPHNVEHLWQRGSRRQPHSWQAGLQQLSRALTNSRAMLSL
jgi:hypothetical protein